MARLALNLSLLLLAGAVAVLDVRSAGWKRGVTVTRVDRLTTVYRTNAGRFESSFGSFKWRLMSDAFDHVPHPNDKSWVGTRRYNVDALVVAFGHELIEATARGEGSMKATFRCTSVPCIVVRYRWMLVLIGVVAAAVNGRALARWWRAWHSRRAAAAITPEGTSPGSSPPPPAAAPSPPPPRP